MTQIDHSEFVIRHHGIMIDDVPPSDKGGYVLVFAALITLLYIAVCAAAVYFLKLPAAKVWTFAGFFLAAFGVFAGTRHLFYLRSAAHSEKELLREVIEGSRGARLIVDAAGNAVYANRKFEELCGAGDVKVSFQRLAALFDNDKDTTAHFNMLAEQAQRGLTDSIELVSRGGDDKEIWYQVTAQPVAGHAGYVHWRIDDITHKRAIDRAIRDEHEKLIDFTDNAPVGFFSVDEDGRFVFVNATLARWLGEDIQNLLKSGHLHTYIENPPKDANPYDIHAEGGAKQMGEVVMKGPGGRTFSASVSQAVVKDSDGVVRTRGVVHDLTAEREMRRALQASEDKFQRFFEEAPLAIAMLNSEGILDDYNASLLAMLGYSAKEMAGRSFEALVEEGDRQAALSALDRIEKGQGMRAPKEISLLGKDNVVAVQMYARRLAGSDNIVLHFIDLTEQKRLEQQFVQSQKMQAIGQLAGGVAHDFNNLLTAMIGFCDLLLLRHKPGDPSFSDIMQIKQNSNRAANLVRQLLAFSRQQTLRPQVQDLTDILTEVSHLLRRLIGAGIELDVRHGTDLGFVKVDAGQMEQVLINLAVNARDAMEGNGHLTVQTYNEETKEPLERGGDEMPAGEWVVIEVADSGCGMPEEVMAHIFEPFFTTKDVGEGTGLGLATVYGIVRQTGGYLHVESKVGEGTTFKIYLPRIAEDEEYAPAAEKAEEDESRDLTGTATIMLVEDEDAVRTFSSRALSNKGYAMLEAASGDEALKTITENEGALDLLITDVMMPNMDGPTLVSKVRESLPDLKIIFISGYTEEKLKEYMGENIWFLPKPFTLKQLAAKVKVVLDE